VWVGLVLPLVLVGLDPGMVVWRSPIWGDFMLPVGGLPLFWRVRLGLVTSLLVGAAPLYAARTRILSPGQRAVLGGALVIAGAIPLAVATVLLPLSLIGSLFFGVGLLGLLPFWTAWVWLRIGFEALNAGALGLRAGPFVARAALGAACFICAPVGVSLTVHRLSLEHRISAAVATRTQVDFSELAPFEWDRVALYEFMGPSSTLETLGFEWQTHETQLLGKFFNPIDATLIVFASGNEVVRSAFFSPALDVCVGELVASRARARFVVHGRTICPATGEERRSPLFIGVEPPPTQRLPRKPPLRLPDTPTPVPGI